MDKDILNEVIGAEKDIQERLEREQARLREIVDHARREAEESVARAARECSAGREDDAQAAREEADARARMIVDDATALAGRLERLNDEDLAGIVLKRIPRILME